jgi:hypothetical protein
VKHAHIVSSDRPSLVRRSGQAERYFKMTDANAIRFNIAFILWCALFVVMGGSGLAALSAMGRLPAPPITATNCIDEKFKFLHNTDIRNPGLIAVGSSVTWRNLDFSIFTEHYGHNIEPLNAAPCYLYVNQTAYLANFLVDHMPSVKSVMSVFSMRDFSACSISPTAFFQPEDAESYVFDRDPAWYLYLKNFRPLAFARDVIELPGMRSGENISAPLVMDLYGSGPLTLPKPEIRENFKLDPTCLDHLSAMSENLSRRDIDFVVVLIPQMPAWRDAYDPGGVRDAEFRSEVARRLEGTRTFLIDAQQGLHLRNDQFTDHAHLQWSSVPLLMRYLISQLDKSELSLTGTGGDTDHAL